VAQISQKMRELIRSQIETDDEEALRLLELYDVVDEMCLSMEDELKENRGTNPSLNGHLREVLREIHPMLRLRNELQRELRTISRPPRREYEEDQEEERRSENRGTTKVIANRRPKPSSKNRQHRNRVTKGHNGVSNES